MHEMAEDECMELPPGFRFHPTDEEIITHYLSPKVVDSGFSARAVGEVDLNKCEPWDLPKKARMGEKEWYFFCLRDRKYPTGTRTNRATEAGYWKATGKDKEIYRGKSPGAVLVGMKKTLVFYRGRAPRGQKTNWVTHEYRLEGKPPDFPSSANDEWVVCRVFHKNIGIEEIGSPPPTTGSQMANYSLTDQSEFFDSTGLPPLMDPPPHPNSATIPSSSCFISSSSYDESFDDFKAIPSMADQHAAMNYQPTSNCSSLVLPPSASSYGSFESTGGYLHREQPEAMLRALAANPNSAIRMHCKMEPFSSQSPDTDQYCSTDISSMASKPYEFVDPSSSIDWEKYLCKY